MKMGKYSRVLYIFRVVAVIILLIHENSSKASDHQIGMNVRKVFIELLDATDPRLSTLEKKLKMVDAIINNRSIIKELFFKHNKEIWEEANFRISYDKVKDRLKLGPFTSLLYQRKSENDLSQVLSDFNQMTFNIFPAITKEVIQHFPLLPHPMSEGFMSLPWIREATDHEVEAVAHGINTLIINFRLNDSHLVQEIFSPPEGFDLQQLPEDSKEKFMVAMQEFINHFPLERKRMMARALLELPPNASLGKIIAATSVHAGPLFVKLLQLLQNFSPLDMQRELKVLLDGLPPHLTEGEVRKLMEANVPEPVRKRIIHFDYMPLSVASLGQVHQMILELRSGKVVKAVVKFLAPKFTEMTEQDLENFENVMKDFKFGKKMVASMKKIMSEELNLQTEAKYTQAGVALYRDETKGIDVVDILQGDDFPVTRNMIAQTFAHGKSLSKMNDQYIKSSGVSETEFYVYLSKALLSYMKKWFKNAIFEEIRLAHADSHQGNIFFSIEKQNDNGRRPYRLTIIDFGSMCKMTKEESRAVALIGQGLFLSQTSDIMIGLYQLSRIANDGKLIPEEIEKLEKLRSYVEESRKVATSMHDWFNRIAMEAMRLQIDFPTSFLQFNRGRIFIEKLVDEALSKLRDSSDPQANREYRKLMGFFDVYMASSLSSMLKDLGLQVKTFGHADSIISIPTIAAGSVRKCATVIQTCLNQGPSAAVTQEIYPFMKNLYDVTNAITKDLLSEEMQESPRASSK
jgi:predicted unusual protein kinase regulating ubiquinone biosynthesis (AarF/ABC1/UbiB family)